MKTYGTIALEKGKWVLDPRPDVVIKLKRFFPKVSRRAHGKIRLSSTPDVCRDLAWFLARYPLEWSNEEDRRTLENAANEQRERESLVEELLAGRTQPQEFELALPPREYQRVAADMCLQLGGLLLADDLGLGKTCSAIAVLSDPRARPALVVCPTHLPKQWQAEIQRFCPKLRVHILTAGKPYDFRKPKTSRKRVPDGQLLLPTATDTPDVIISNYHKLSGWADTLAPIVRSVVFDEVQELRRGSESAKGSAALHIAEQATIRLGLSATPIYNQGGEIWNVMQGIRPWALGTREEFHEEWCSGVDQNGRAKVEDPQAFGLYLRDNGLMLRRTRAEVGRELAALTRIPHFVDCDEDRVRSVESAANELARTILAAGGETVKGQKFRASEELSNLVRQATGIAKAPYVADFVRLILETGEQVVLFGWQREVYSIWQERLKYFAPTLYTGSESPTEKDRAKQAFVAGDSRVLLMSLRSGAGVDGLQHCCRTTVHGELDWSPAVHEQCDGRVHRDGQKEPVMAYYLISEEGSDPIVADVLGVKRSQVDGIRNPEQELVEKLTGSDGSHIRRLAESYMQRKAAR